jgi:hypothetical protein
MSLAVNVNIIRVFQGPRHDRLRFLWDCAAEAYSDHFRLRWFANPLVMSHAECLQRLWREELARPERFAIITEHDFLPDLHARWLCLHLLDYEYPVAATRYATRGPNRRILRHNYVAPWFVVIDKDRIRDLHWEEWGEFHDPANGMKHFLEQERPGKSVKFIEVEDCFPEHYGISCYPGTHLAWSRHYHDAPEDFAAGICLGDIQRKHDAAVSAWVRSSPDRYRVVLMKRMNEIVENRRRDDAAPQEIGLPSDDLHEHPATADGRN